MSQLTGIWVIPFVKLIFESKELVIAVWVSCGWQNEQMNLYEVTYLTPRPRRKFLART